MKKVMTNCFACKDGKILLGLKKRGFGEGKWNGFGGKVGQGETIEAAALRELHEESGIEAQGMRKVGILEFSVENDPVVLEVHIFTVTDFLGEPVEGEEMKPRWFAFDEIPFCHMWPDDAYWLPLLLSGKLFKGAFLFDQPTTLERTGNIVSYECAEVSSM